MRIIYEAEVTSTRQKKDKDQVVSESTISWQAGKYAFDRESIVIGLSLPLGQHINVIITDEIEPASPEPAV